ncbi:uncharacterized protein PRCAT00000815001 [Priceomyces carsonii]|uniref:uncharacterized protein n=1 Tax=Priceomyces carsonii TaxID=28549 RepID=UPI002ED9EB9E|nr:unnamed protein product [Priceomyces carsonii]
MSLSKHKKGEYYPVVIDIGSRFIRAGFAGEPNPIAVLSTSSDFKSSGSKTIELPPYYNILDSSLTELQKSDIISSYMKEDTIKQMSVIYNENLNNWIHINREEISPTVELILIGMVKRVICEKLVSLPKNLKVIVVDPFYSLVNKFKLSNILLNNIKVKSVSFISEPLLSIIGSNAFSGLVLNFGWDLSSISAVMDMFLFKSEMIVDSCSGLMLHFKFIERLLELNCDQVNSILLNSKNLFDIIESFIVNAVYVRSDDDKIPVNSNFEIMEDVFIPSRLRYEVVESIFFDDKKILDSVRVMIDTAPIDYRKSLLKNIIITGGISHIPGFKSRMMQELRRYMTTKELEVNVSLGSWSGCSLYISSLLARKIKTWTKQEITRDTLKRITNENRSGFILTGFPDPFNYQFKKNII